MSRTIYVTVPVRVRVRLNGDHFDAGKVGRAVRDHLQGRQIVWSSGHVESTRTAPPTLRDCVLAATKHERSK